MAAISVGEIYALLRLRDELSPGLKQAAKNVDAAAAKLKSLGSALLPLSVTVAAVGGSIVKLAMDAVESENLFEVSFKGMAGAARAWSEETSRALGLNAFELRKNSATLYTMTTAMGLAKQKSFELSTGVVKLAADMASFFNISTEDAFAALRSGLVGETEPLKRYGILIDEATIKGVAYQQGIAKIGAELTQQEKVLARYVAIMQQTGNAQGDLARTIDSPTNQLRVMQQQVINLGIQLGAALLPAVTQIISFLSSLLPYLRDAVQWFTKLPEPARSFAAGLLLVAAALGPMLLALGGIVSLLSPALAALGAGAAALLGFASATTTSTVATWLGVQALTAYEAVAAVHAGVMSVLSGWMFALGNSTLVLTARVWLLEVSQKAAALAGGVWAAVQGALSGAMFALGNTTLVLTARIWLMEVAQKAAALASGVMAAAGATAGVALAALGYAAAIAAAAFVGWKIGEWIGGLKLFENGTVSVTDKLGMFFARMMGGEAAVKAYRENLENGAFATKQLEESIKRVNDLQLRLSGAQATESLKELEQAARKMQAAGELSAGAIKRIAAEVKQLEDAGGTVSPFLDDITAQAAKLKELETNKDQIKELAKAQQELDNARASSRSSYDAMVTSIRTAINARLEEAGANEKLRQTLLALQAEQLKAGRLDFVRGQLGSAPGDAQRTADAVGKALELVGKSASPEMLNAASEALAKAQQSGAVLVPTLDQLARSWYNHNVAAGAAAQVLDIVKEKERIFELLGPSVKQLTNSFLELQASAEARGGLDSLTDKSLEQYVEGLRKLALGARQLKIDIPGLEDELSAATARFLELGGAASGVEGSITDFDAKLVGFKASLKAAFEDLPNVIMRAFQGGGNVLKSVGSSIFGGIFGKDSQLVKSITGGLTSALGKGLGGALGSIIPGLGTALGGLLGGLGDKLFGKLFKSEEKKVNDMRDAFLAANGGWQEFQKSLSKASDQDLLKKIFNAKTVKDFEAAVREAQGALDAHKQANEALQAAIDKYGFTIEELGPKFKQQKLDEMAAGLLQDYRLLTASGIDQVTVLSKMSGGFSEYVQTALRAGLALPESMRPMLEQLIQMGQLTDEAGNKMTSLEGVTFTETLTEGLSRAVDAIEKLVAALTGISRQGPINIPINFTGDRDLPGSPKMEGFAGGTHGFRDFGSGTPVVLHGKEAVITEEDFKNGRGFGPAGPVVTLNYSPQLVVQGAGNQDEILRVVSKGLRNDADGLASRVKDMVRT